MDHSFIVTQKSFISLYSLSDIKLFIHSSTSNHVFILSLINWFMSFITHSFVHSFRYIPVQLSTEKPCSLHRSSFTRSRVINRSRAETSLLFIETLH